MRLKNSTTWSDRFLRRMVAWCCREVGYKGKVRESVFRTRSSGAYSGHAYWPTRIVVSIGPDSAYPTKPDTRPGLANESFADRLEGLIAVTAHEIQHLAQYAEKRDGGLRRNRKFEFDARWHETQCLRSFRAQRESLVAEWSEAQAVLPIKAKPGRQEKNALKARAALARWERKLKLAGTKVKQYRAKVRYYERKLAAKGGAP